MGNSKSKECLPKVETGLKTGVLNLSSCGLSEKSSLWSHELIVKNSSKLKVLDLSNNTLTSFPAVIFRLVMLKTLNASNCSLNVGCNLCDLNLLVSVDLTGNYLVSSKMFVFPVGLRKLKLGNNKLDEFPSCMCNLSNLTELDLSNNQLKILSGIGSLISMVELSLNSNEISVLPVEMGNLRKLRLLSVERNRLLPIIPKELLGDSGRQCIPKEVFENTNVVTINLSGNSELRNIDVMQFDGVESFLERRKLVKDKNLAGGADYDASVFGLT